ncbi:MAG TPA: flavin reductase family protein [Streptosporangiaceae bacterium]|nr:flavin reductase family protein [Streptosporangiaceae bacterium]
MLGHFCTGATVITAAGDAGPAGFACQAFAALSLEPPLVLFCPSRSSLTWPVIARAGHFCANLLADGQQELARGFGTSGRDKFAGVPWSSSPSGAPVLDGALTWVECAVQAVHEAGDHYLVVGRVTALGECRAGRPLLFYRGRYAATDRGGPRARPRWWTPCSPGRGTPTGCDILPGLKAGLPVEGGSRSRVSSQCRWCSAPPGPSPAGRAAASSSASCPRS